MSYAAGDRIEETFAEITKGARYYLIGYSAFLALTALLCAYLAIYMWSRVAGRLERVTRLMTALADGDTSIETATVGGTDEVGQMSQCVEIFRQNTLERTRLEEESRLLGELNEWLQLSNSLSELFDNSRPFLEKLLPDSDGAIYIYSNSRDVLDGISAWRRGKAHSHIRPSECWALRRGRRYSFNADNLSFKCAHEHNSDQSVPSTCFPILADGETVGLMHLSLTSGGDSERFNDALRLAGVCAEQLALAIANVQLRDELHQQSMRDHLTGLYNRRFLTNAMLSATQESTRRQEPLSIVSIDVDHFKVLNDTDGHDAGDAVLRALAEILNDEVRHEEMACRSGGEEFMLIWPRHSKEQSLKRADDLRQRIEQHEVIYDHRSLRMTVSMGIAEFRLDGNGLQEFMRAADDALHAAKHAGRNCCVVAASTTGASGNGGGEQARSIALVRTPS